MRLFPTNREITVCIKLGDSVNAYSLMHTSPKKSVSRQLTTIGQQLTDVKVNITHVFVNLWLAADKQSTDSILMIYVRMVFIKGFLSR